MSVLRSGKLRFKSTPLALFLPVKYLLLSGPCRAKVHHRGEYRVVAARLGVREAETGHCNSTSVPLSRSMCYCWQDNKEYWYGQGKSITISSFSRVIE